MHLGMPIGVVCLTEDDSIIVCPLCAPQVEFSKLLNFISHITREHGCTTENEVADIEKIRSEVIGTDFLKECNDNESSTRSPKDFLYRIDVSMYTIETKANFNCVQKTEQELGNENYMNIVKNENDNINLIEINLKKYFCHHCKTNFLSGKEVVEHICNNISPTCTETKRTQNHSIHTDEPNYKCDICNKTFLTKRGFRTHKARIHSKTHQIAKKFYCDKCDTKFRLEKELVKHTCSKEQSTSALQIEIEDGSSIIKNNNQYSCTICSAKLKTSLTLKNHTATHHANKPFKCKYCPQSCISSSRLKQHLQTHEPSTGKTVSCPHCSAMLKSQDTLRYHLLTHTAEKTIRCDYCNGSFYTHSKLTEHLKSSHAALFGKEFRCAFCSALLPSKKSLKFHIMKHKGVKPYKCEQCPLEFYRSYVLKRHVLTHSGKPAYKCEQCPRAYYLKGRLREHMIVHSGNKPFKCDQCSSEFTHSSYLKRHMITHSGKKPYKCEHCISSFARKHSLNIHIKTHTEDEITNVEIS